MCLRSGYDFILIANIVIESILAPIVLHTCNVGALISARPWNAHCVRQWYLSDVMELFCEENCSWHLRN